MAWILGPKPRRTESGVGVHVEYKLDDGLAAPLPFGGLMKHYIGAAVLSDEFNDAQLRPDGLEMVLGGGERGLAVWDLDPSHWVAAACRLAGRNLTRDEWDTYLSDLGSYRSTCPEYPPSDE